jgi:hypothetical protein
MLNGITVLLSVTAARVPEMVRVPQKSPPFTAAFQVGDCIIEQGNELVICVVSIFCGHFADYYLQQLKAWTPILVVHSRTHIHISRWKINLSLSVDIHVAPVPVPVEGGEPVDVHANPDPFMHEWQNDGTPRMVEGHHIVHPIVLTIFGRLIPVVIEPMSRLRHQWEGYISMVEK